MSDTLSTFRGHLFRITLACLTWSAWSSVVVTAQSPSQGLPGSPKIAANSQVAKGSTATQNPGQDSAPDAKKSTLSFDDAWSLFEHDFAGRFGRSFEYDFQRVEQPQVLQIGSGTIIPNPEHYLNEHTLKFQLSELFPSETALLSAFNSACTLLKDENSPGADKCTSDDVWANRIAGGGGWWARALSGLSLSVDLSERPDLQQGVVVVPGSFAQHYQVSGSFDFDPAQLFLGGANWKAWNSIRKKDPGAKDDPSPDMVRQNAAPRLLSKDWGSAPKKGIAVLAAFVPTVSYKRVSQFDFIKSGGVLVPTSYLDSAQNQYSFHWDLKRSIPSSASRSAAVPDSQSQSSRLCVLIYGNVRSFISVSSQAKSEDCHTSARANEADSYALGCVTKNVVSSGQKYSRDETATPEKSSCWAQP